MDIRWYHEFDFLDGSKARSLEPDVDDHRKIWDFIESSLDHISFKGKTVLDIGAWDGFFSFYAKERGAAEVVAVDDLSQNWSSGLGIFYASQKLNQRIEIRQNVSIYDLYKKLKRKFDIIFCFGVYYHLDDPIRAMAEIRKCCHVETSIFLEGDVGYFGGKRCQAIYSDQTRFLPNLGLLNRIIRGAYMRPVSCHLMRRRHKIHIWLGNFLGRLIKNRIFCHLRPFVDVNSLYKYKPPFGLEVFDERWGG